MAQTEAHLPELNDLREEFNRAVFQLRASIELASVQALGGYALVGAGATLYASHISEDKTSNSQASVELTQNCQLGNMRVRLNQGPGAGQTLTVTLLKNSGATPLVVTISDTALSGTNTTDFVDFVAGDRYTLRAVGSAGALTMRTRISLEGRNVP